MNNNARAILDALTIKIETYWNVNLVGWIHSYSSPSIKIETYWNVNIETICEGIDLAVIKIETYWNVNQEIKSVVNPTVKLK